MLCFKMDIQGHKDIYDQTAGYIAARRKDPQVMPLVDHRNVDQLCKPLHEGLKDCALHHAHWPFSAEMSHQQQCNRLLDIIDHPVDIASNTTVPNTADADRLKPNGEMASPVGHTTPSTVAPSVMRDVDINSHCPDFVTANWLRMYGLCVTIGWCLGILCYTVFWRGTEMLRSLITKLQRRTGMIQAHKSSHAFSYVSSLPVSTKLDNRLNWSQPAVERFSEVGSILDLTTSMTV